MPLAWLVAFVLQTPFTAPTATLHAPPEHDYHLRRLSVHLSVDPDKHFFGGYVVDEVEPLSNGIKSIHIDAGADLKISRVSVDGVTVVASRSKAVLTVPVTGARKGRALSIRIDYSSNQANARGWEGGFDSSSGGWHWIDPKSGHPDRRGFWTLGWPLAVGNWAPTWAAPNDFATSETYTTVPADWVVVGNGKLVGNSLSSDRKKRTWVWRMDQPHATYLLSLVGGPLAYKRTQWKGIDLWYVGHKSDEALLQPSFAHVPDMIDFFSERLGVPYPWGKLAEDAMDDFSGGMENVSAVTLDSHALIEARDGRPFTDPSPWAGVDSLVSHELAHQWFGDLATYQDWGDSWLSEGFATFMQTLYTEHSCGEIAYLWEVDRNSRTYEGEATRYRRPISTQLYQAPTSTFDAHAYQKGSVILHTLRRKLGDEKFFGGLKHYLNRYSHRNVVSASLREAMTEATGVNMKPFWAQWIEKPGHPILRYSWIHDAGQLKLTVSQIQDRSDGTPIYDLPMTVGMVVEGKLLREQVRFNAAEQTFTFQSGRPAAVLLDPDHDFLREIRGETFDRAAAPFVARLILDPAVRTQAFEAMLSGSPSPSEIEAASDLIRSDNGGSLVFRSLAPLARLKRPELQGLFVYELGHPNTTRVSQAIDALALLPADPIVENRIRGLVSESQPIEIVLASLRALAKWSPGENRVVFERALRISDRRGAIKALARQLLGGAGE